MTSHRMPSGFSTRAPHVSVCVPMFNGERYLRECIESILVQTYTDFELLLVDDGSTDDTRRIAESYARTDTRIRLNGNTENLGLVENWNHCIALARADWIKFVFQDDTIHPECLARMLAAAAADVRLVSCQRTFAFDPATQPAPRVLHGKPGLRRGTVCHESVRHRRTLPAARAALLRYQHFWRADVHTYSPISARASRTVQSCVAHLV